ncbi:hypothetical protein [Alkalitalea saponilacus]|uniref:DUF3592 domain-containing protein n=1 Tax=Alkalitalea saponilacus TaxID=889453 RepID=A0A1T5F5U5_9BACT|nr:hypothetical protein [Alkalitalea saponilacus]ASB50165.1 hypothetical protein CDL62_13955 [Alkalitalea saponilacus]SKB91533.1 hypothetical protein SAMN03080601_01490 [Alkalitalea saponilacus]
MKTFLSKIDAKSIFWDNTFLLGKIILVLTIIAHIVYGIRILPLFKTVNGEIVEVYSHCRWTMTNLRGNDSTYDCMALRIDSFKRRIIHRNTKYADSFKPGDEVKLWFYRMHGEYIIVQANRGDEIIIKHNGLLANIVFVLMVGSFMLVLLEIIVKKISPSNRRIKASMNGGCP